MAEFAMTYPWAAVTLTLGLAAIGAGLLITVAWVNSR